MHTFQINVLILFLLSSTCFEHQVFIVRKTICTCRFYMECFYCWIYKKKLYKISKFKMLGSENIDKSIKYGRF